MGSPPPSTPSDSLPHSWPILDFSNPLSYLFQAELQHPPFSVGSSLAPSSPFNNNPPPPLSSQAAMGTSTTKVSKRKSRAVPKPLVRFLSADRTNFRDMVQRLTGMPSSPSMQSNSGLMGSSMAPPAIFRPMPARPFAQTGQLVMESQSMPTLDTSTGYLSMGVRQNNLMNGIRYSGNYGANYDVIGVGSKAFLGGGGGGGGGDLEDVQAMESLSGMRPGSDLQNLLLGSHKFDDYLPTSWLSSSDIMHMSTPTVEIAHSA